MVRGIDTLNLFSENPSSLAEFYEKTVGLPKPMEAEIGEGDDLYIFELGGCDLAIMSHEHVKGTNKEPERIIFNLEVSDIEEDVKKVEEAGAKKIEDIYHVEGYGYISTFEDPDGNYFQLVQVRES